MTSFVPKMLVNSDRRIQHINSSYLAILLLKVQWHTRIHGETFPQWLKQRKISEIFQSQGRVYKKQQLWRTSGRCQTLIWKPEDTVQSLESPRLFGRVDSTDYAATYPFLYCGRLIDFGISLYFMTYQPRKLSCFFFKFGPLTPSVEGYLDNAIFARKNHQKSIVTTQMSRVQGGHGFISVPLILFVPQLFEMNYQSILLGRVYVSKSGFNSVQIIKTPFVKVLLSD